MEESVSVLSQVGERDGLQERDLRGYSPLALAYIGDAVYDLIIRTAVVERGNQPANKLHKSAVKYVNAAAQAAVAEALEQGGSLTEEELTVYRRGKNAKPHTMAKNASPGEYRKATGLEALVGYLYLSHRFGRVLELLELGLRQVGLSP